MTAATTPAPRATLPGVIRGEWIKTRGVRSTWWVIGLSVVVPILVTTIWALNAAPADTTPAAEADAVLGSVTSSIFESLLLFVLLGALLGTSEYDTRTITTTMAAVPRRWPIVVAKTVIVAGVTLIISLVVLLTGFLIASAIVPTGTPIPLTEPGMIPALLGTALFQTCTAVISVNVGFVLRSSIGAIAGTFGFLYVVPGAINLVPLTPVESFANTFPGPASDSLTALVAPADGLPYGLAGIAVLAWTVAWIAAALWTTSKRDV